MKGRYFRYNLLGVSDYILLTEEEFFGLKKLQESLSRMMFKNQHVRLELDEVVPIPDDCMEPLVMKKAREIVDETLKAYPQYTREEVVGALKNHFKQKFKQLSFLYDRMEGVRKLPLEVVDAFVKEKKEIESWIK